MMIPQKQEQNTFASSNCSEPQKIIENECPPSRETNRWLSVLLSFYFLHDFIIRRRFYLYNWIWINWIFSVKWILKRTVANALFYGSFSNWWNSVSFSGVDGTIPKRTGVRFIISIKINVVSKQQSRTSIFWGMKIVFLSFFNIIV